MGKASSGAWQQDLLTAARNYCDQVTLDTTGKHIRILMTGPTGMTRAVFASSTPSDHRTLANTVKQVRQVAAQIGSYR